MDDAAAAVEVKFITEPIPAPGGPHARYLGGRLTYYGAAEIIESTAVVPNVSVRRNDVVRVASSARAVNNHDNEPFLAQVRRSRPTFFLASFFHVGSITLLLLQHRRCWCCFVGQPTARCMWANFGKSRRFPNRSTQGRDTADLGQINSSERREKRPFRGVGRTA